MDAKIEYINSYTYLTEVNAYTFNDAQDHIYGCGYQSNGVGYNGGVFKVDIDGTFNYFYQITSTATTYC